MTPYCDVRHCVTYDLVRWSCDSVTIIFLCNNNNNNNAHSTLQRGRIHGTISFTPPEDEPYQLLCY